jgi:phosphoglycolate phosphatase
MNYRAVLFDLDGTLINSTADIAWAANTLLARRGLPTHPPQAFHRFIGDGVKVLVTRILPTSDYSPAFIDQLVDEFRALYAGHWNVETAVYPGIPELLVRLREAGVRMAVLSNKPHDFTVQCVDHFLPGGTFDVVLGAGGRFAHKPDPAGALQIAKDLALDPRQCVYVGDTDTDMQTATRAGMRPVGVLWGMRGRDELLLNGAETLVAEPHDLLRLWGAL